MRSALVSRLFVVLAPLTVPAYLVFLAAANLVGGAFYIVIEATVAPLAGRPIALSRRAMAALALPVIVAAPVATAVHLVWWLLWLVVAAVVAVGRWQTGLDFRAARAAAGLLWTVGALWITLTCFNAGLGARLAGCSTAAKDAFVEHFVRYRSLGDLPEPLQSRRRALIAEIQAHREAVEPRWESLLEFLSSDDAIFTALARQRPLVAHKLVGLPWFFQPAEVSEDGLEHSALLLAPLLFAWLVLLRWPGTFRLLRPRALRVGWFAIRLFVAVGAIYWVVTWEPITSYPDFWFIGDTPPRYFVALSPAAWLGADHAGWVRPDWYLFNAALWLLLAGLASFGWYLGWRISPMLGWPRYYIAFLAARLLQRRRIAFFSVGAVTLCVAMMIIVISVMGGFVDSIRERARGLLGDLVMNGGLQGFPYYEEFLGHIRSLRHPRTGEPIVQAATPLIHSYGILQFPRTRKTSAVEVWGVRLEEYVTVNEFGKDLFYNNRFGDTTLGPQQQPMWGFDERQIARLPGEMDRRFEEYLSRLPPDQREEEAKRYFRGKDDPYPGPGVIAGPTTRPSYEGRPLPGIIIGRHIIARRTASGEYRRSEDYPRGEVCYLTVLPLTRTGDVSPESPPKPAFRYADDSRTGIHEIDSKNVYVGFERLQELLTMGPQPRADGSGQAAARCSQIQIKLVPAASRTREALLESRALIWDAWKKFRDDRPQDPYEYDMMRLVDVATWEEMQRSYIAAIEKEKFLVLIMFGVISIVAVFLILCIFYMIVQEKTRDIGIIKSVGGSAEGVAAVFLAYGGAIGLVGGVLGSLLGVTFVHYINDIQDWLARLNPAWRVWSPETYSFDKIPDVWKWGEVIWISVLAVVASILGATFPAVRAGRTWPVESLRYE